MTTSELTGVAHSHTPCQQYTYLAVCLGPPARNAIISGLRHLLCVLPMCKRKLCTLVIFGIAGVAYYLIGITLWKHVIIYANETAIFQSMKSPIRIFKGSYRPAIRELFEKKKKSVY